MKPISQFSRPFVSIGFAFLCCSPIGKAVQGPLGYYGSADATNAATLRASLHAIIDDHLRFPFTSGGTDTWDILELADEDPGDASRILDVYRNASYAKAGGGNSFYDREHAWPSSYGFTDDGGGNYPYSDCHALFLCNSSYNSSRGNKPFRNCDPGCAEQVTEFNAGQGGGSGTYPGQSNWTTGFANSGTWETWIGRRGDVARALLYLDVRYEGGLHGVTGFAEPQLVLTDDENLIQSSTSNESLAYMGMLSVLLSWHVQDPVDAREMLRNDTVYSFQGNRNPFIDHPEWVAIVYDQAPGPLANVWINELHYDNDGLDVDEMVEIAGAAGTDLGGYRVIAYSEDGSVYDTFALSGTIPDQGGCLGTLSFATAMLQNGPADGLALVDPVDQVIEFLSYEGVVTATMGPAFGATSSDVGVLELPTQAVGLSLGRVGFGLQGADFVFGAPSVATPGSVNGGQTFGDACGPPPVVPPPTGLAAQSCGGFVQLNWDPSAIANLAGYHVYRSQIAGSNYAKLTSTPLQSPSFLDTALSSGTTYYYVVTTVDTQLGESANSSELFITAQGGGLGSAGTPWINEFHYDNASTDVGEFVEVAGPAGVDLAGYQLIGYSTSAGTLYATVPLSGLLPSEDACLGALAFPFPGLQNGDADGIALVDPLGTVLDFLSYEGSVMPTTGPAAGMTSTDVGVSESSLTPIGQSLQRAGTGQSVTDFAVWQAPLAETPGAINSGQAFVGGCGSSAMPFGCGLNPNGSLTLANGTPSPGQTLTFAIDNPLGTQTAGSPTLLFFSVAAPINYPCGLPLPGYGMASPTATGQLLVNLTPGLFVQPVLLGSAWNGAGQPGLRNLALPAKCSLVGVQLYFQGAIFDLFGPIGIGLTNGLELVLAG